MLVGRIIIKTKTEDRKVKEFLEVGTKVIIALDGKEYDGEIVEVDKCPMLDVPYRIQYNNMLRWFRGDGHYYGTDSNATFRVKEEKKVSQFKVGDKVRLKEKFYDEPVFKKMNRDEKKEISKNVGFTITMARSAYPDESRVSCDDNKGYYTIPESLLELAEKPVVEVKREANVGEYVKALENTGNCCVEGKAYMVIEICTESMGGVYVRCNGHSTARCGEDSVMLWLEEYVVLENYKPIAEITNKPTNKIDPKVGMWAEITKFTYGKPVGSIVKITSVEKISDGVFCITYLDENSKGDWFATIPYDAKLLSDYKPMRKWTDAEIMEAKAIVAEQIYLFFKDDPNTKFGNEPTEGEDIPSRYHGKRVYAHCCKTDEWNIWIGRMVAMCKATGRDLPAWISKGAK